MLLIPAFHLAVRTLLLPRDELYIPSPIDIARDAYAGMRAHCAQVQREQEQFQDYLQALGIERLERRSGKEVRTDFSHLRV